MQPLPLREELGLGEGEEVEGTFCDKQVCEGAGTVQLNGDCRGHAGKTGRRHSSGRMSQGLKCTKPPKNEHMQACPRGLTFWVVARSHTDEKQEATRACGSKHNFGQWVWPCPVAGGFEAHGSLCGLCSPVAYLPRDVNIKVTHKIYTLEMVRCPKELCIYNLKLSF